jgi:hypothetical protein
MASARRPEQADQTSELEVPAEETGRVPVSFQRVEPHWFGIAPAPLLLGAGAGALLIAIVLFATGHWPFGLILLGVAALLAAAYVEAARRRPRRDQEPVRGAAALERAGAMWETLRTHAAASAEAKRLQSGIFVVESERRAALLELGEAVYAADAAKVAIARTTLAELDARDAELHRQMEDGLADAGERIRRARLAVQRTELRPPEE